MKKVIVAFLFFGFIQIGHAQFNIKKAKDKIKSKSEKVLNSKKTESEKGSKETTTNHKESNTDQNLRNQYKKPFDEMANSIKAAGPNDLSLLSRVKYDSLINAFTSAGFSPNYNDYNDYSLKKLNDFYVVNADSHIQSFLDKYDLTKIDAYKWRKSNRESEGFEDKKNPYYTERDVDYALKSMDKIETYYQQAVAVFPSSTELQNKLKEASELHSDIATFKSSGELQKMKERMIISQAEKVRMEKPRMNDATVDAAIKKAIMNEGYAKEIKRIVITSSSWTIEKAYTGVPLKKYVYGAFAYVSKEDGNCYMSEFEAYRTYNGSAYENVKITLIGTRNERITCGNVSK